MKKPKLVAVELETCHANTDGTAWYAYVDWEEGEDPDFTDPSLSKEIQDLIKKNSAPLGWEEYGSFEEVPNALSRYTHLRRFYVASAA